MIEPICGHCSGSGTLPGAMHYVGLGTSEVTFCTRCADGQKAKSTWTMSAPQVSYRRRLARVRSRQALEESDLGLVFAVARLEDFMQQPTVQRALTNYLEHWPRHLAQGEGLYLVGPTGVGKTHALTALVRRLLDTHLVETLLLSLPVVGTRLHEFVDRSAKAKRSALLARMTQVQLLVLDDLGLEKHSAWVSALLAQVIDERWRMRRPVLLAGPFSLQELKQHYTPQMLSRVKAKCEVLNLEGPDRRNED